MIESTKGNLALVNPNWSAFVLMVTFLSIINSLAALLPLPDDAKIVLRTVNMAISVVLWADFVYLLRKSPNKRYFMVAQHGWMVLLGSIPMLRFLRIIWFHLTLKKSNHTLRDFLAGIVIKQDAGGTLLSVLFVAIVLFEVGVVAILSFEETAPGSNITSISDAFWWASTTVTTGGFGDKYPVFQGGRLIAVLLMILGIALFSVITGSLAEWFRGRQLQPASRQSGEVPATATAVAEIRDLLEQQMEMHQQSIAELKGKIIELEERLEQPKRG